MYRLIKPGRMVACALLLVVLVIIYVAALYKLQIVEGAAYYERSRNNIVTTQVVPAARGNILDRYGRLLVSNRTCNNLVVDTKELFEQEDPNAIILQMVELVESFGDRHIDELPITMEPPFEYVDNMTAIQRTCLNAYLADKGMPEDTTAVELMAYFRERYSIDNSYDARQMRIIAGVRYELNLRYIIPVGLHLCRGRKHGPGHHPPGAGHPRGGVSYVRIQHLLRLPHPGLYRHDGRREYASIPNWATSSTPRWARRAWKRCEIPARHGRHGQITPPPAAP